MGKLSLGDFAINQEAEEKSKGKAFSLEDFERAEENIILDKDKEILELKDKLRELKDETSKIVRENTHTEEYVLKEKAINSGYELKEKAMDNILKLVSIQDVSNLSRE